MSAKISAFIVTLLINVAFAIVILLGMIVAMNGFSESDATWGLGSFIVLAFFVAILASVGAVFLTATLLKKQIGPVISAITAIAVFSIAGVILEIVCSLLGIGVAEFVRVNY